MEGGASILHSRCAVPVIAECISPPELQAKFARAPLRRGRPKSDVTKVRTTLRLDPDVPAAFRSGGPGWRTRINDALRKAAGPP